MLYTLYRNKGGLLYPLYPQIGISLGRSSIGVLRKLASFIAYLALIKVKVFTLELAKVKVKT